MSEIKVSKISSLSAAQTLQIGGKGMMIGGTAENTTLIISTTAGGIPTVPHGDMSLFITDGTVQSTYGYQTTSGSVVGEFLGTYSNHPVGIMTNNATKLFITPAGNVGINTTTPDAVLDVPGVKANTNGVMNHYTDLAQLATTNQTAGSLNGALQIVLPYAFTDGRNTVMTVKIMGHSYRSKSVGTVGSHSWEVTLTAYFSTQNAPSAWWTSSLVPTVEIQGHAPFSTVRLGARLAAATADAGKAVILLGDDTTQWNAGGDYGYTVAVTDLWTSYSSREGWGQGWKINNTPILDSAFASQFETVLSGKMFTCRVDQYTDMNGNVGIGTTGPTVKLDVAGGIRASQKVITEEAFALAPTQLHTTERTFTQVFTANGSGSGGTPVVAGDAWLIGTFSESDYAIPGFFRFVHNSLVGNNLQSGSYEWARSYAAEGLALGSPPTTGAYTEWVELPVSISIAYGATRNFRFDVRKQNTGNMQLRMRAMKSGMADGAHNFTFTTTGSTIYTPAASGGPTTTATAAPSGFHGRQSYEFPVSRNINENGYCGFTGSTAGLFILNNGNVGIGFTAPGVALDVSGSVSATGNLKLKTAGAVVSLAYASDSDNYRGLLGWNTLQLGNNGPNRIVAGSSAAGGNLNFYVNNTTPLLNFTTPSDGITAMSISSSGRVGVRVEAPEALLEISGTPVYQTADNWVSATTHTSVPHLLLRSDIGNTIPEIQFMERLNKSWVLGGNGTGTGNGANGTFCIRDDFQSGNPVRLAITNAGNVGIGTTGPTVKLDVVGGIKASTTLDVGTTLNVQSSFALASDEVGSTQRTFTQRFYPAGSGTANATMVGDSWLLGTFGGTDNGVNLPTQFKFVHNTHTGNNLQSDSYEWGRHYGTDAPGGTGVFSNWVELPVSISITYNATRNFRFDVRKQSSGPMELRMRCVQASIVIGSHYFTFTTTGNTIYTPNTSYPSSVAATSAADPNGFHGRQSYEFPVSNGGYGFSASTKGVFILNNGMVGIGRTGPVAPLSIAGTVDSGNQMEFHPDGGGAGINLIQNYNRGSNAYTKLTTTANSYAFNIGATEKVTIDSSGNVGIGTTNPLTTLHVKSAGTNPLRLESTTTDSYMQFKNSDSANISAYIGHFTGTQTGMYLINQKSNHPLYLGTNDSVRLTIAGSGEVSIAKWANGNVTPAAYIQSTAPTSVGTTPVGTVWYVV